MDINIKNTTGYIDAVAAQKCSDSLKRLSKELEDYKNNTKSELRTLGTGWGDRKHDEFDKQFQQDFKKIETLISDMEAYAKYLHEKSQATIDYDKT